MRTPSAVCAFLLASFIFSAVLAGCGTSGAVGTAAPSRTPVARSASEPPVPLLIDGEPVGWETITPLLAEASGDEIVRELALESALRRELSARGLHIDDAALKREHERWIDLLGPDLAAEAENAIRQRRGLGPERFRRLLWRNAALRALLDPAAIAVSDEEVRLAAEIRDGRRYAVSIVTVPDAPSAVDIAQRASGGGGGLWIGASRHGVLPRSAVFSPVDPAVPDALRRTVVETPVGSVSGAVALDEGYAVVLVHALLPARDGGAGSDRSIREVLEARKARAAMERLAERMASRGSVHVLDRSLSWGRSP